MSDLTISIFGSKIFLEIISEIKLFSKFKIKYYDNFNLCIKDAEKQKFLAIFFATFLKKIGPFLNKFGCGRPFFD